MDPIIVSWSEIDAGRQCNFKHHLAYKLRYSKPPADDSALGKGIIWHNVMEIRYDTILNHQVIGTNGVRGYSTSDASVMAAADKAVDAYLLKLLTEGTDSEVLKVIKWMYDGYVKTYGLDKDNWIVGVETTHLAPLGDIETDRGSVPVLLKFKIDRTVRDKFGVIRILDEKSMGATPSAHEYDFHDQFPLYVWGLRKLGIDVRSVIHSAAKSKPNKGDFIKEGDEGWTAKMKESPLEDRFKRVTMQYTPAQLETVRADALADVQALYGPGATHQRQPDNDRCRWRCDFTEPCYFGRRTGKESDTLRMLELTGFEQNHERH